MHVPGYMARLIPPEIFNPVQIRAISFDPSSEKLSLFLDSGDTKAELAAKDTATASELYKYFQVGLRLPNNLFWVNLRPDSPQDIIDPYLEQTDIGRILLAADLQLKKDLALFTSPDRPEGKQYWDKLYVKAESLFGQTDMEIPTFTRPWIVPGEIIIRESADGAYIYKAGLQVMLEQDYLKDSPFFSITDPKQQEMNAYSSELLRAEILPKLTREINSAKRYAALRQVYYSLVLAQWFKQKAKGQANAYAQAIDTKDLADLTAQSAWSKDTYYNAYKKSFSEGEYKKEEQVSTSSGLVIRTYFSGGVNMMDGGSAEFKIPAGRSGDLFTSTDADRIGDAYVQIIPPQSEFVISPKDAIGIWNRTLQGLYKLNRDEVAQARQKQLMLYMTAMSMAVKSNESGRDGGIEAIGSQIETLVAQGIGSLMRSEVMALAPYIAPYAALIGSMIVAMLILRRFQGGYISSLQAGVILALGGIVGAGVALGFAGYSFLSIPPVIKLTMPVLGLIAKDYVDPALSRDAQEAEQALEPKSEDMPWTPEIEAGVKAIADLVIIEVARKVHRGDIESQRMDNVRALVQNRLSEVLNDETFKIWGPHDSILSALLARGVLETLRVHERACVDEIMSYFESIDIHTRVNTIIVDNGGRGIWTGDSGYKVSDRARAALQSKDGGDFEVTVADMKALLDPGSVASESLARFMTSDQGHFPNGIPYSLIQRVVEKCAAQSRIDQFWNQPADETRVHGLLVNFIKSHQGPFIEARNAREAEAAKDGGRRTGGIDFRALPLVTQPGMNPAMTQPTIDIKTLQVLAQRSKIQDLDKEWYRIEKQIAGKAMPYEKMKEYIAVCSERKASGEQLDRVVQCLTNILRLEEVCAVSTSAQMKELLVIVETIITS